MTLRSILDIEIPDGKLKAAKAIFDKMVDAAKRVPVEFGKINPALDTANKKNRELRAGLQDISGIIDKIGKQEDHNAKVVERTEGSWRRIVGYTSKINTSIFSTTLSIAKWSALGLLGGGAGLFGLDRLGASAAGQRRNAGGLGVSTGQANAFGINFQRFVDAGGLLSGVSNAIHDVTSRGYVGLLSAGLTGDQLKGDAASVSNELLKKLPGLFKGTSPDQIGTRLKALNLDEFLSQQDVSRYLGASPEERRAQHARYQTDAGRLDVDPGTSLKWQNFVSQIDRAGASIENSLIKGLVGLAQPIEKLSDGAVKLIDVFSKSDTLKGWIDNIGSGLETFAKWIGTPEFKASVEDFAHGVGEMGRAIGTFMTWIGRGREQRAAEMHDNGVATADDLRRERAQTGISATGQLLRIFGGAGGRGTAGSRPINNPGNLRPPGQSSGFMQYDSEADGIRAMANQLRLYQNRDHLDTVQGIINKYAPPSENDVNDYVGDVSKRSGFAAGQKLNLNDNEQLAKLIAAMTKHENVKTNYTPKTVVEIINATGGNAVITSSQVAQ